jgi:surfeit locus 1 family protein
MGRFAFLVIIGIGGAAILVSLGVWQVQRLAWKEGVIADINARIAADPVPLPAKPDPERDAYLPVEVTGTFSGDFLRVLVSQKGAGAGYRIISPLVTEGQTILVDRGFVPVDQSSPEGGAAPQVLQTIVGNLQWPQEVDSFTPEPDLDNNIWFARDVPAMARSLGAAPILVVQRETAQPEALPTPLPVDTSASPNDHLQYAVTWFSLAAIWIGMSLYFLRRGSAAHKN